MPIIRLRLPSTRSWRTSQFNSQQLVKDLFQRVPPFSQLFVLIVAIWGPIHAPVLFSFLMIFVNVVFVASNARTAWGMRFACEAVDKCAGADWRAESGSPEEFDLIKHLIILPNYKETLDTLRETISVLASHPGARRSYVVCLGCEEAEKGIEEKARGLIEEFGACFFDIQFTLHPRNLPGEAAGKSSNVAWASREMHARGRSGDIITVMDADSCFAADFFAASASKYTKATPEARTRLMFVAPIFFDRNASDVAAPVVCTDILWCAAGVGTMYDGSRAKLPTSAYAMSTALASRIGFWDAGPEAIGEDLHMSVKAFFETNGALIVEPIFSPASQCNVVGFRYPRPASGHLSLQQMSYEWVSDLFARYAQAKRHMWGALDSGYAIRRVTLGRIGLDTDLPPQSIHSAIDLEGGLESAISAHQRRASIPSTHAALSSTQARSDSPDSADSSVPTPTKEMEDPFSASTATSPYTSPPSSMGDSPILRAMDLKTSVPVALLDAAQIAQAPLPMYNLVILMSRLYEAHFNLGFLFILLSVAPYFNPGLEPTPLWKLRPTTDYHAQTLHPSVLLATAVSAQLGTLAFICTALIFYYYEKFHHITTTKRWENRPHLGQRANQQTIRSFPSCMITYAAVPFTLLFGILPLYHAQASHIYSNRLTYQVSAKPSALVTLPRYVAVPMEEVTTQ